MFSPRLCPPNSSVLVLVCPLAPPSGACTGWRGCSWWRAELQTGCGEPALKQKETLKQTKMAVRPGWKVVNVVPTSSLKFLKAATLSSTLSWLRGSSFNRSMIWQKKQSSVTHFLRCFFFFFLNQSCAHVVGSVHVACVVLVKECHQV